MLEIHSLDDPRVAAYRNLPRPHPAGESIFVTKGPLVTRRLLSSRHEAESVLVAERFAEEFQELAAGRAPLTSPPRDCSARSSAFTFTRACWPPGAGPSRCRSMSCLASSIRRHRPPTARQTLFVCPEIAKPENMGLVFRAAGAFGIDGVLLGSESCDPFARRCLRVSMGGVLHVPWIKSATLATDLRRLKHQRQFQFLAAVVDADAPSLANVRWPPRVGIVLGNEFTGLDGAALGLCDARATIPMELGMDSLNLGVAAAVFAYERKFGSQGPRTEVQ